MDTEKTADKDTIQRFIDRWTGSRGMERVPHDASLTHDG